MVLLRKGRWYGWERNHTILLKVSLASGNEPRTDQQGRVKTKPRAHTVKGHLGLGNVPGTDVAVVPQNRRSWGRQMIEKNVLF